MTERPEAAPALSAISAGPAAPAALRHQRIALVDLLDRVLACGVVVAGDVTLSIADVDLVTISLRALVSSATGAALDRAAALPGVPAGPDQEEAPE